MENVKKDFQYLRLKQNIIRYISCVSIFSLTLLFTPNFQMDSFPILLLSSLCIVILDYLFSVVTGIHDIPLGRGIVGFTTASVMIYITQFFVSGYYISIISSLIAAAIYGIIDSMLPNKK